MQMYLGGRGHFLSVGALLAATSLSHCGEEALVVLNALQSATALLLCLDAGINLGRLTANLSGASETSMHYKSCEKPTQTTTTKRSVSALPPSQQHMLSSHRAHTRKKTPSRPQTRRLLLISSSSVRLPLVARPQPRSITLHCSPSRSTTGKKKKASAASPLNVTCTTITVPFLKEDVSWVPVFSTFSFFLL